MNYDEIRSMNTTPFDEDVYFDTYESYYVDTFSAYVHDQLAKQYFRKLQKKYGYPPTDKPVKIYLLNNNFTEDFYEEFYESDEDNYDFLSRCLEQTGWKLKLISIDSIRTEYTGDFDKEVDENNLDEEKIRRIIERTEGPFGLEFEREIISEINLRYAYVCAFTNKKLKTFIDMYNRYNDIVKRKLAGEYAKISSIFAMMFPLLRYWSRSKSYYQDRCVLSYVIGTYEDSGEFCSFSHLNPNFIIQIFVLNHLVDEFLEKLKKIIE